MINLALAIGLGIVFGVVFLTIGFFCALILMDRIMTKMFMEKK